MQTENMQQPAEPQQYDAKPTNPNQYAAAPQHDPVMQQLAAQQAMLNQMAADQQAMWQHLQAAMQQSGSQRPDNQGGNPEGETSSNDQGKGCQDHKDPAEQAEQFVRMAEKFSRGEVDMETVTGGLTYLNSQSSSFWKGLLIGGGLTLLISNEAIRDSFTGLLTRSEEETK